jgi:cell division protein FtsQ
MTAVVQRRLAVRRPRARTVLACAALVAVLAGAWLWVRDSSLVSVDRVTVTGLSGPEAGPIRQVLVAAARKMTTLDVQMARLRRAVAPFTVVRDLKVSPEFPHGLRIHVALYVPVAAVTVNGRTIAVAGDGTLLRDLAASPSLPSVPLASAPAGRRLTDPAALGAVSVLAAAPSAILDRVSQVTTVSPHGTVAQIRGGPSLYFGDTTRLSAKWAAAAAVLADSGSAGASYIDVSDPERPAAGANASAGGAASSTGASPPSSTGASPPSSTGASPPSSTGASPPSSTGASPPSSTGAPSASGG